MPVHIHICVSCQVLAAFGRDSWAGWFILAYLTSAGSIARAVIVSRLSLLILVCSWSAARAHTGVMARHVESPGVADEL